MTRFLNVIGGAFVAVILFGSGVALAACPVGRDEGDTWCDNGTPWKCERCGSEYCSIIQPGSCLKNDAPFDSSGLSGSKTGAALLRYAQDDSSDAGQPAMDDLMDAEQDGQEAVAAPTDEGAKEESNETFDTPHDSDGD